MKIDIDPCTAEGQKAMQRRADQRVLVICRTFNDIQTGPNPLTPEEVRRIIDRHPERYSCLEAYASSKEITT